MLAVEKKQNKYRVEQVCSRGGGVSVDLRCDKKKMHRETLLNRFRPRTIVFGERTKQTVAWPLILQALKSSVAHTRSIIPVRSGRKENTNKYLYIPK